MPVKPRATKKEEKEENNKLEYHNERQKKKIGNNDNNDNDDANCKGSLRSDRYRLIGVVNRPDTAVGYMQCSGAGREAIYVPELVSHYSMTLVSDAL